MAACGAKTRAGPPCRKPAMANGRCKLHGGKSTGAPGNQNAVKHGIYGTILRDDEQEIWRQAEIGSVEAELRLLRVRLVRLLKAENAVAQAPNDPGHLEAFAVAEIKRAVDAKADGAKGKGKGKEQPREQVLEVVSKRPDFHALFDRLIARIAQLEELRSKLLGGTPTDVDDVARKIREAVAAADDTVPEAP